MKPMSLSGYASSLRLTHSQQAIHQCIQQLIFHDAIAFSPALTAAGQFGCVFIRLSPHYVR